MTLYKSFSSKIKVLIFFITITLQLYGCNSSSKKYSVKKSFELDVSFKDIDNKIGFGTYNSSIKAGFYFIDNSNILHCYEDGNEISNRFILKNENRIDGVAFDPTTNDLFYTQSNSLFKIDSTNTVSKIQLPTLIDNYNLSSLTFEVQPKVINSNIYLNIIKSNLRVDEELSYKKLMSSNVILKGKLNDNQLINYSYTGSFPKKYISGENYNNYYCNIEINNSKILISYSASDSVSVIDSLNKTRTYYFGSKNIKDEIKQISFKDLEINSRVNSYVRNEAKYIKVIYDPFKKQYYRIYQLKNSTKQNTVSKWGIVIYNSEFEFINDIIFDSVEYTYLLISPTKEGLIISKALNNYAIDKIKFDIISFN
jgi:hypothetical protein